MTAPLLASNTAVADGQGISGSESDAWLKSPVWLLTDGQVGKLVTAVISLALSLLVLTSPPPETLAVLVTEEFEVFATSTVTVIAG